MAKPAAVERPRAARARDRRLGRTDWMEAGQAILRASGIADLRLATLTEKLKVSSGSFYHHFRDMDEYLGALAEHYSAASIERLLDEIEREVVEPLERLRTLARRTRTEDLLRLDRAMRVWAASEPRAAVAMARSEAVTLAFFGRAFEQAGFSPKDAETRARLLVSLEVAQLLSLSEREMEALRADLFARLSRPDPGPWPAPSN